MKEKEDFFHGISTKKLLAFYVNSFYTETVSGGKWVKIPLNTTKVEKR